jgi:hypothetical protein
MLRSIARRHAPALSLALLALPTLARAQGADRLHVSATWSRNVQRLHSIAADSMGLSYELSYSPSVNVDLRAIDLPVGKGAKPSLHLSGGVTADEMVLGPPTPSTNPGAFQVLDFSSGIAIEAPMEAFLPGNAGVAVRLGWSGGYLLTRTGGQNFLERSLVQLQFVRTSGALQGSTIGVGHGRDETYGWDSAAKRWDVGVALQGRLLAAPASLLPGAPPVRAGAKPAAPPLNDSRLLWAFADLDVSTDGGPGADGLRGRVGVGLDLNAFVTAVFTPLR